MINWKKDGIAIDFLLGTCVAMSLVGFVLCLLTSSSAFADTPAVRAAVTLKRMKTDKTAAVSGDELYFNVTSYSSLGQSRTERIPEQPAHWDSKALDKVQNIPLWTGSLQEGEEMKLILSVVEQEFPIWNNDELIGGAQLKLSNQKGELKYEWEVPLFEENTDIEMHGQANANPQLFLLKSSDAVYEVAFSVEQR